MMSFSQFLTESSYKRYLSYLSFVDYDEYEVKRMTTYIKDRVPTLKRDDVIQWYLMWWRGANITNTEAEYVREKDKKSLERLIELSAKTKFPASRDQVYTYLNKAIGLSTIQHYLSLPIPEIQNFRFTAEYPPAVIAHFQELEKKWQKENATSKEWIDITDELKSGKIKKLISFSDSAWFSLERKNCKREAEAMGHCGNEGTSNNDHVVLSFRWLKQMNRRIMSRPSLTFIYDKGKSSLGEMKGRANQKPKSEYHEFILALLRLKIDSQFFVKKIEGGGYKPENNFSISDLSETELKKIVTYRPELLDFDTEVKLNGGNLTGDILSNHVKVTSDFDIRDNGVYVKQDMTAHEMFYKLYQASSGSESRLMQMVVSEYRLLFEEVKRYFYDIVASEMFGQKADITEEELFPIFKRLLRDALEERLSTSYALYLSDGEPAEYRLSFKGDSIYLFYPTATIAEILRVAGRDFGQDFKFAGLLSKLGAGTFVTFTKMLIGLESEIDVDEAVARGKKK